MRAVATLVVMALLVSGVRLAAQAAGYRMPQTITEGTLLSIFVEVTRPARVELTLRDAVGPVGSVVNPSATPGKAWLDKVKLSRTVPAGSTLQMDVATTPHVGSRFGVSVAGFVTNATGRVVTSAPTIREPVRCTGQDCEVCYTLEQGAKAVQFDSYNSSRTIVKPNFDPDAPVVKGTFVARWRQWPMDAKNGNHYVRATADGQGTDSDLFTLPPGPAPTKCP